MSFAKRVLWALLFASVFVIGLILFAPASFMGYVIERTTQGSLTLARTQGSLWQGSGVAVLRQKSRYQVLGNYRWALHPFTASLELQADGAEPMTVRLAPTAKRIEVSRLHLTLPATIMSVAAPELGPYQLQGTLDARADQLNLSAAGMEGQVTVDWRQAASALSEIRPLGDYRIVLNGKGQTIDAQLTTVSGALKLTGQGGFDHGAMRFSGTAQAAAGAAEEQLKELLHHIGPETSPGVFALALMPQGAAR